VETRCVDGYKVMISDAGHRYGGNYAQQMLDQNGHAIPCR